MSNGVATLTITAPDGLVSIISLMEGRSYRVGRNEGTDIVIPDPAVSRMHAVIVVSISGVAISDLSSTNGTFVNGERISAPVDLSTGDLMDFGAYKVKIDLSPEATSAVGGTRGRTMTAQLKPSTAVAMVVRLPGYRTAMDSVPAAELQAAFETWLHLITSRVQQLGGKIDKILHDNVLAVWYEADGQKAASSAVEAAKQVVQASKEFSVRWDHHERIPWTCSVALHAGMALMGSVGGKSGVRNFAVLGDTLNVGFRVAEAAAAAGQACVVTDTVAPLLQGAALSKLSTLSTQKGSESITIFTLA